MKNLETRESCKLSKICSKSTWPVSRASCENSGNQRVGVSARVAGGRGVRRECRELLTPNRSCEFFEIRNQRGGTENQRCDLVFLRDHPPSKPASRESGNQRVATEVVKFWKSARVGTENQRVVIRCFCVTTLPHKCGRRCRGCHRQSRQVARAHRVRQPRAPSPRRFAHSRPELEGIE